METQGMGRGKSMEVHALGGDTWDTGIYDHQDDHWGFIQQIHYISLLDVSHLRIGRINFTTGFFGRYDHQETMNQLA